MNANSIRYLASWFLLMELAASGVTFQFSAPISQVYGPGADTISNWVAVAMTCTGTVSYDPVLAGADADPSTNNGIYGFDGAAMEISLKFGTNVFRSTTSSSCYITVAFELPSPVSDGITYETRGATLNDGPVPGTTDSQTIDVSLSTTNLSALASDGLPTQPPVLSDFPILGPNGFHEVVFYTYKNGSFDYGFSGTLSSLAPIPVLSAQYRNGQIVLSWPTHAAAFQLQSTSSPSVADSWSPAGGLQTVQNDLLQVALPANQTNRFFRLRL